jgi:carboxymethylenebutenolidase
MSTKKISLKVSDGSEMQVYVSIPEGKGPFPAVIVFQEAFGVTGHIRSVADRIAKEGFVAIAPELFHRTAAAGFECGYNDFNLVMPHFQAITVEGLSADSKACYDWLQQQTEVMHSKVAAIGFCLGGRVSFVANTAIPIVAAVSYYGGGIPPVLEKVESLHAPQLFFWGGLDKHIGQDQIDTVVSAMNKAGKPFTNIVISNADHGFNNDERPAYNPEAAKEAWAMSMAFFRNKFGK